MSETTREIRVPFDEVLGQAALDLTIVARRITDREKTVRAGKVSTAVQANVKRLDDTALALRELASEVNRWPREERDR